MSFLVHLADRVLNRPLLITPEKAEVILAVLGSRIGVDTPDMSRFVGESYERDADGRPARSLPYKVTPQGVGIITITGSLVNRGAWVGASSGVTSYEGIKFQVQSAAADPNVRAIILDIQSPGGEAVGAFETAAVVREAASVKPVTAVVNGMAASAAYAIASGATEVVTTETGVSGSIGVVLVHADYSRMLANEGVKPTLIFAGAHKVDGNPFEPLSDTVRADLQAEVDAFYQGFLATVAKGRGKRMTAAMARKTEARTFVGEAAVAAGLADRLGSFESVFADLSRASRRASSPPKGKTMSENQGAPAAEVAGIPKADHDAAVASARSEGHAAGVTEGAKAATDRFVAVLGAEGIKGDAARMTAAMDLATKAPAMSAADVVSFVAGNVSGGSSFAARMAANDPNTGAGLRQIAATHADASAGWSKAVERVNGK